MRTETHAVKRCSFLLTVASLSVFFLFPCGSRAQEPGAGGHTAHVFAEFTAANLGQGDGFIWGGSAGAYEQGHVLGWVLRGSADTAGGTFHVYNAVVGPRIALDLPLLKPFVEATGGVGHSDYYGSSGSTGSSWGAAWQVDGGVEHGLLPRLRWRIVEVAYGHIYAGPGVSPTTISTGLTLHVW
jgi:hypothetical protein